MFTVYPNVSYFMLYSKLSTPYRVWFENRCSHWISLIMKYNQFILIDRKNVNIWKLNMFIIYFIKYCMDWYDCVCVCVYVYALCYVWNLEYFNILCTSVIQFLCMYLKCTCLKYTVENPKLLCVCITQYNKYFFQKYIIYVTYVSIISCVRRQRRNSISIWFYPFVRSPLLPFHSFISLYSFLFLVARHPFFFNPPRLRIPFHFIRTFALIHSLNHLLFSWCCCCCVMCVFSVLCNIVFNNRKSKGYSAAI